MGNENNTPTVKGKSLTFLAFICALVGGLLLIAARVWNLSGLLSCYMLYEIVYDIIGSVATITFYICGIICIFNISGGKKGSYNLVSFSVLSLAPFLFSLNNIVKSIPYGGFMYAAPTLLKVIALAALVVTLIIGFQKNNLTIAKYASIACVVISAYFVLHALTSLRGFDSSNLISLAVSFISNVGGVLYSLAALLVILAIIKGDVRESTPAERKGVHILIAAVILAVMVVFLGVMLASCQSDNDYRPNTSDGYVGDNDGDGDVDEKDFEREWKDYLNENMP